MSAAKPHSEPCFIAIVRGPRGKAYHQCRTYAQALAHKPYCIEYVNGFGQVVYRENFERLAWAKARLEACVALVSAGIVS